MAMDVLQAAALNSLVKEVLPKLQENLEVLGMLPAEDREADENTLYYLKESLELLTMLTRWAGISENEINGTIKEPGQRPERDDLEEMSDEEARAMLSLMDEPTDFAISQASENTGTEEMSDEEARKMLNLMDQPMTSGSSADVDMEMSDEEARKMLNLMDQPMTSSSSAESDDPLSDEEARSLLSMMDAPIFSGDNLTDSDKNESRAPLINDSQKNNEPAPTSNADQGEVPPIVADGPEIVIEDVPEWVENDFSNDADMIKDFITNSDDLMETLDRTILSLEKDPTEKETIEEIFRAAHTLKGAAGMFGFTGMESLMHKMENLFDLIRKGKMHASSEIIDVVFQGLDTLRILLEAVKARTPSGHDIKPVVRALINVAEGRKANAGAAKPTPSNAPEASQGKDSPTDATLSKIMSAISGTQAAPTEQSSPPPEPKAPEAPKAGAKAKKPEVQKDNTIRVDLERLDMLVSLVGELVTDRTRFSVVEEDLRSHFSQLSLTADMTETVQLFSRHMNEVQDIIMKIRMVPIGNEFNKFPRVVRDLARQLNKKIDLKIIGDDTELDKTLVEQIGDPLIHLIRNACDHGVENPADRLAAGKSEGGVVVLAARQEGNNIIITIQDDGKGMDPQKLKQKAIEKGLISPTQTLTNSEIFNLIFEAGFSTAEKITNVSGRGVGMDVVRKQIAKLKGTITIDSTLGSGSIITISLPLTLAIVQSLLIKCREEIYAIPLSSVVESIRISPKDIQRVGDMPVVKRMGKVLPLVDLSATLELSRKKEEFWYNQIPRNKEGERRRKDRQAERVRERLFVVVVGSGEKRFGIIVDSLMNQQEMVIKPMGSLLKEMPCIAGGAVLGTGQVVLVLDVGDLESYVRNLQRSVAA